MLGDGVEIDIAAMPLDAGPLAELNELLSEMSETERSEILCALLHMLVEEVKNAELSDGLLESVVAKQVRTSSLHLLPAVSPNELPSAVLCAQIKLWSAGKTENESRREEFKTQRDTWQRRLDELACCDEDSADSEEYEKDRKQANKNFQQAAALFKMLYKEDVPMEFPKVDLPLDKKVASPLDDKSGVFVLTAGEQLRAVVLVSDFVGETDSPDELVTKLDVAYEV